MSASDRTPARYASASDLPMVIEMRQQIKALKALSLIRPGVRAELRTLKAELDQMTTLVDRFYDTLGERNWLFTEDLNLSRLTTICELSSLDEQEAAFVGLHQESDTLRFMVRRLWRHPGLRERMPLLETAMEDYLAGRYAGMIHILISVADGFVNDFETNPRKGLHAREGDDMTAWDSIISHHKGLAHVHETVFRKPFKKLHAIEVSDLYRNGIVHGMVTNYANEVVATKAWNYLFAVADWATAREEAAKEPEPEPSLGELFRETAKLGAEKEALAAWERREVAASEEGFGAEEVVRTCTDFLELWRRCNYGGMAQHLGFPGSAGSRCKPGDVKDLYKGFRLTAFELRRVRVEAAAVAKVDLDLEVGGSHHAVTMRWIYHDDEGRTLIESEGGGRWHLVPYGPTTFITGTLAF